jgi:hypothetical protein
MLQNDYIHYPYRNQHWSFDNMPQEKKRSREVPKETEDTKQSRVKQDTEQRDNRDRLQAIWLARLAANKLAAQKAAEEANAGGDSDTDVGEDG